MDQEKQEVMMVEEKLSFKNREMLKISYNQKKEAYTKKYKTKV